MNQFTNEEIRILREVLRAFDKRNQGGGLLVLRDDGKFPPEVDFSFILSSLEKELELTSKFTEIFVDILQDSDNRSVTRKTWSDSARTKPVFTTQITYRTDNNILKKTVFNHIDKTQLDIKFSYDQDGNLISINKKVFKRNA